MSRAVVAGMLWQGPLPGGAWPSPSCRHYNFRTTSRSTPSTSCKGIPDRPQMKCFYDLVRNVLLLRVLGHSVPAQSPHGRDRLSCYGKVIRFRKGQRNINAQEICERHADSTHLPPPSSPLLKSLQIYIFVLSTYPHTFIIRSQMLLWDRSS